VTHYIAAQGSAGSPAAGGAPEVTKTHKVSDS